MELWFLFERGYAMARLCMDGCVYSWDASSLSRRNARIEVTRGQAIRHGGRTMTWVTNGGTKWWRQISESILSDISVPLELRSLSRKPGNFFVGLHFLISSKGRYGKWNQSSEGISDIFFTTIFKLNISQLTGFYFHITVVTSETVKHSVVLGLAKEDGLNYLDLRIFPI